MIINNTPSVILTECAPAAIGPYSQAIKTGNTVYISGQIALNPVTMQMVDGGFRKQAEQVFQNLEAIAQAAGGFLSDAVKLTVYLTDLDNFSDINDVMSQVMGEPYPARAAVEVAALPRDALVEIDAILHLRE